MGPELVGPSERRAGRRVGCVSLRCQAVPAQGLGAEGR